MRERAQLGLTLSLLLLFGAALLSLAYTAALDYDSAYNASVAKNVALGVGYASSYHELVPFDPTMTLGPAVILPLAAWLRVFGAGLEAPLVYEALQNLALLLLVLWVAWTASPEHRGKRLLCLLGGVVAFANTNEGIRFINDGIRYWYLPYGEVPAALLVIAGALLWFDERPRRRVAGATLLGLSLVVKLFSVFGIAAVLLTSLGRPRAAEPRRRVLAFALLAPSLWWWAWIAFRLGREFPDYLSASVRYVVDGGSGLADLGKLGSLVGRRLIDRSLFLVEGFGGPRMAAIFFVLLIVGRLGARDRSPSLRRAATALLWSGPLLLLWWLPIAQMGFLRHLCLARYCVVAGMALDLSQLTGGVRWPAWAMAATLLLFGLVVMPHDTPRAPRARLASTAKLVAELERDPRVMLVGSGWWVSRTLEYALPGALHFHDVRRLTPAEIAGRTLYLVRSTRQWNTEHDPTIEAWTRACERHLIAHPGDLLISKCADLPNVSVDVAAHHW